MSTRCNIELYNENDYSPGAMLYHHDNGFPEWMGPELERSLKAAYGVLCIGYQSYWWDAERVAALIIAESAKINGVPKFQPCMRRHGDIAYLWEIHLAQDPAKYEITARHLVGKNRRRGPEWTAESEVKCE